MRQLFKLNAAPIAALGALTFVAIAAPASAHAAAYCRRDVSSYMLSCGFDTMAQCQAMSSGRGGDCLPDPFQGGVNSAYAYAPGYSPSQGRRGHAKATIENR
jgi:hypothetical protein